MTCDQGVVVEFTCVQGEVVGVYLCSGRGGWDLPVFRERWLGFTCVQGGVVGFTCDQGEVVGFTCVRGAAVGVYQCSGNDGWVYL